MFAVLPSGKICYTQCIIPLFSLLRLWLVRAVHEAVTVSPKSLLIDSLPVTYYFFDYATAIYSAICTQIFRP